MRNPYEVLGLKEGASKDEVIRKYDMLLRRQKAYQKDPNSGKKLNIDEINEAYNEIMGYNIKVENESTNRKRPVLELLKIDPEKYDNFWEYNRTKLIVITIVAIFAIVSIYQIATNVPYDFNVKFMGTFGADEIVIEEIEQDIKVNLDTVENPTLELDMGSSQDPQMNMALTQKLAAQMAAGELDIFICNKDEYERYAKSGFFMELSEHVPSEVLVENQDLFINYVDEEFDDKVTGYYGIRVPGNGVFSDIVTKEGEEEFIFCLSSNSENVDSQMEFWNKYVLEYLK